MTYIKVASKFTLKTELLATLLANFLEKVKKHV
jgi:hypothetical protein